MHDHPTALMLFAAGRGTRMGALTATLPKPLIKVAGRPLIDHALALVEQAGIGRVVVNTHHFADLMEAHLHDRRVLISDERDALLETGGGLRRALALLGGSPVYTLNSDAVWTGENPLTRLVADWDPDRMDALLMLAPRSHAIGHAGRGDFDRDGDGRLHRGRDLVYTGAQIIRTDLLSGIDQDAFSLNLLWDLIDARGRLFGVVHRGGWCDVGTPTGLDLAGAMLKAAQDV